VSVDTSEDSARLAEGLGLEFPLLSDVEREAVRAWGVAHEEGLPGQVIARPASFLVERDGTISWRSLTDNWRVRLRPEELLEALGADS
jgi:peroxiredoxin